MAPATPPIDPYVRLVTLLERELELAGQGRVEELAAAVVARGEFLMTLPSPAPDAAEPWLLRARALHSRVTIETERLATVLAARRSAHRRAWAAARRYTRPAGEGPHYSTSA
ncbi:hypothetical protein [Conexibacter sp. DBS9H8]|uniref:hypothetical protein n=1 Tax=Conexibacter sp. DBS9H8 TaxID=2937801 RepID=UPI0020102066|nr:hypothetical protein [Conexibacter sp. DBS9H8]